MNCFYRVSVAAILMTMVMSASAEIDGNVRAFLDATHEANVKTVVEPVSGKQVVEIDKLRYVWNGQRCVNGYGDSGIGYNILHGGRKLSRAEAGELIRQGQAECTWIGEVDLSFMDFSSVNLRGTQLFRTNLKGSNLEGAQLDSARFEEANLTGSNLSGASAPGANFKRAGMMNIRLIRAYLRDADLSDTKLMGASLEGAMAAGAWFSYSQAVRVSFKDADLTGTDWALGQFSQSDFSGAILVRAYMHHSRWVGADLRGANMTDADTNQETNLMQAKYNAQTILPEDIGDVHGGPRQRGMIFIP